MPTFPDDALVCRRTAFARRNRTFYFSASLRCHISDVMAALCGVSDHHHDLLTLFIAGTLAHIRIDHIPCVVAHDYKHRPQLDILLLQPAGAPIKDSPRLVYDFGCCARSARAFPPQHVSRTLLPHPNKPKTTSGWGVASLPLSGGAAPPSEFGTGSVASSST
jgi:hypothetical protein